MQLEDVLPTNLRDLMAAKKGSLLFKRGEAFILHVFWEAPNIDLAHELLSSGLCRCAAATCRDSPTVPTYFFRISSNNSDLCNKTPKKIADHVQLKKSLQKIERGVPRYAIQQELIRRRLDPSLLEQPPDADLPESLQQLPVAVEFTEIYLDERAFMLHAGSRDYLDGYGVVMNPAMHYDIPSTIRLGTPTAKLVEGILEPVLKEIVIPLEPSNILWQFPNQEVVEDDATTIVKVPIFLSLDLRLDDHYQTDLISTLPTPFKNNCTTCVSFTHPFDDSIIRLICVLPVLSTSLLSGVSIALKTIIRGEAHSTGNSNTDKITSLLLQSGLGIVSVNSTFSVGYVLHDLASQLTVSGS